MYPNYKKQGNAHKDYDVKTERHAQGCVRELFESELPEVNMCTPQHLVVIREI